MPDGPHLLFVSNLSIFSTSDLFKADSSCSAPAHRDLWLGAGAGSSDGPVRFSVRRASAAFSQ